MHICADAPLALTETDHLSIESNSVTSSHRDLNGHDPDMASATLDFTDAFDLDIHLSGSLSDLVVNFDDNVYNMDTGSGPTETNQAVVNQFDQHKQNHATLSQVKFWWREAVEEQPRLNYPLGELNSKLDAFDDFESADADGITEDGLPNENEEDDEVADMRNADVQSLAGSECSHQDSVAVHSIHASSNSLRSTTPDPHTQLPPSSLLVHTPEQPRRVSPKPKEKFDTELEALHPLHPLNPESGGSNANVSQDLNRLSVDVLQRYVEQLSAEVMNLSDQLVELLAARDELVMLREASDDFVILLNLIHQRRARASRAALLLTARTRLRPRGLFRVAFPWLNRSGDLSSASSMSSVTDSVDGLRPVIYPPSKTAGSVTSRRPRDTIDLNATTGSAAYYKSLNLNSNQRPPRTHALLRPDQVSTIEGRVKVNQLHSDHGPAYPNGNVCTESTVSAPTLPWNQVSLVSPEAQKRLDVLRKQCASLPWPNNQPQLSQSLNLCLPYRLDKTNGVTLSTLRVINQILYGTLLENPATAKLVNSYVHKLSDESKVTSWIDRNHRWRANGHVERLDSAEPIDSSRGPLNQVA